MADETECSFCQGTGSREDCASFDVLGQPRGFTCEPCRGTGKAAVWLATLRQFAEDARARKTMNGDGDHSGIVRMSPDDVLALCDLALPVASGDVEAAIDRVIEAVHDLDSEEGDYRSQVVALDAAKAALLALTRPVETRGETATPEEIIDNAVQGICDGDDLVGVELLTVEAEEGKLIGVIDGRHLSRILFAAHEKSPPNVAALPSPEGADRNGQ